MSDAHLLLLTKLESLDGYTHTVLHQFPKLERHLLCAAMRDTTTRLLRLTIIAWKRKQKAAALFDLDVELEVFRGLIRKSHSRHYINDRRLGIWMGHVNEIGRLVGAWIKSEAANAPRK